MTRSGVFFIVGAAILALAGGPSIAQESDTGAKDASGLLTGPGRYEWQRPDQVIRFLAVREGEHVADIGAGMGYFSDVFSGIVGESGRVYAIETDPELVSYLEQKNAGLAFPNTVVVHADGAELGLPTGTLDLVLTVNTWHRFADRGPLREALRKALKTGGRFVVLDWHLGEIPIAPPVEQRLPPGDLIEEMVADGWTLTTNSRLLKYQYLLVFTPPAP